MKRSDIEGFVDVRKKGKKIKKVERKIGGKSRRMRQNKKEYKQGFVQHRVIQRLDCPFEKTNTAGRGGELE